MKHLLTTALVLTMGLSVSAQNGGQANENNSLKIEFVGQTSAGSFVIKATNKQPCDAEIRVLQGPDVRFKTIGALASDTFVLPISACDVTAKTTTNCGVADFGQVELSVCNILPLRFDRMSVQKIDPNTVRVSFRILELADHKLYIQLSKDGIHFQRVGVEVPASAKVGDTYIVNVKL